MKLRLYTRDPCPLCEHADEALRQADIGPWEVVDIAADADLLKRYGLRIPVVADLDSGVEVGWPLDAWTLRQRFSGDC